MVELSKEGYAPAKVVVVDVGGVVCAVMRCDQSKDQVKPAETGYTCQQIYHSKHIRNDACSSNRQDSSSKLW